MSMLTVVLLLACGVTSDATGDLEALPVLSPPGIEGPWIVIRGRVLDEDGEGVAGAEVFAYHADAEGKYHDDAFRGTLITDRRGGYAFRTLRPGGYGPAPHVHFRVNAPGREELRPTLRLADAPVTREVSDGDIEATVYVFDIAWDR
jgi:protocatechuate 3,4-dioxygenase beta subunit